MSNETKHENTEGHGSYERQDLKAAGIIYFLLALGIGTAVCAFGVRGFFAYLERREQATQPAVSPLLTSVPEDSRHVTPGYPQTAFPSPKLEEDERSQLNGIRMEEEKTLYSYGWIDEKAGAVHIPIEHAMDLLVERGLPVRPQGAAAQNQVAGSVANRSMSRSGHRDTKKK